MFRYSTDVVERYPTLFASIVHASGVDNTSPDEGLTEDYRDQQTASTQALRATSIAELPAVDAWRRAFTSFGVKPTQHRVAVEALLRRLQKVGNLPSISPLVDIGNLVSIRHYVPVAVFDVAAFVAPITVRFSSGTEPFIGLGSQDVVSPEPGEVVFVDKTGDVCARRWCWRQSLRSATSATTTGALFVLEAHHTNAAADIERATRDLEALLARHQSTATIVSWQLSATTPATGDDRTETP